MVSLLNSFLCQKWVLQTAMPVTRTKNPTMNYELLLSLVFLTFHGEKKSLFSFKYCSICTIFFFEIFCGSKSFVLMANCFGNFGLSETPFSTFLAYNKKAIHQCCLCVPRLCPQGILTYKLKWIMSEGQSQQQFRVLQKRQVFSSLVNLSKIYIDQYCDKSSKIHS